MDTDSGSLRHKAAAGTLWSGLSVAGRQLVSIVSTTVLARMVPPSAYGVVGLAALFTNFLMIFRDIGTGSAIVQRREISQELVSSLWWMNTLLGAMLAGVLWLLAWPAAAFYREPQLVPVMLVLSMSFLISSVSIVPSSLLSRRMDFRSIGAAELAAASVSLVVAVTVALKGGGVWSLVAGSLANAIVSTVLLWWFARWLPSVIFSWREVRSVMNYSLNLSGFSIINYFARSVDSMIVGKLGTAQLGYYQMAYNLMLFPLQNVSQVVTRVLHPAFSSIQDDNERFRSAYLRVTLIIASVSFPMMLGLMVVAEPFVRTVLGARWLSVVPLLWILCPVGLIQSIVTTIGQIYTAKGETGLMFLWGIGATTIFVLSFLVGALWGVQGVAIAYAMANVLLLYPALAIPFRLIGLRVRDLARSLAPVLLITLSMMAVTSAWLAVCSRFGIFHHPAVVLATSVAIGVFVYGTLVWALLPDLLSEVAQSARAVGAVRVANLLEARRRGRVAGLWRSAATGEK